MLDVLKDQLAERGVHIDVDEIHQAMKKRRTH